MPDSNNESYISVDIETAGPNPYDYSLLSIGACTIFEPQSSFYVELKPINDNSIPEALAISHLSLAKLSERGEEPAVALSKFETWVKEVTPDEHRPVFVAFNAPFDWMFVNDYFHRYMDRNPFGHAALDIKTYYMALNNVSWSDTSMENVGQRYLGDRQLTHHALSDALDQAEIFKLILEQSRNKVDR
ncbi:MAG: 3'-5' exonuclease [Anaerolineales bacterium]|nr:3'-5' exonuclease [Anaerolineales bacterium]